MVVEAPAARLGVPVQVMIWPEAVQARPGAPAVWLAKVRPLGSVSVKATVPLVAEPPWLASVTLQLPCPPAARVAGGVLLMARRGAVAEETVQLAQLPLLELTVLAMAVTPSESVPTVTVK